MDELQRMQETTDYISSQTTLQPTIGLVLGSGLAGLADQLEDAVTIAYQAIPHFPMSTAPGHKSQLVIGKMGEKTLLCMQGRFHYYEGYSMEEITYPIRIMSMLGIQTLGLTNACGGLDPSFRPGDLMVISDHINFMGDNPLIGPNKEAFGPRFPDMSHVYTPSLRKLAKKVARKQNLTLHEGIYISYSGPSFETPAEIRMFQNYGGSVIGMSTVPEVIVARHCGMDVLAISCVTNLAAGILDEPLSAEEVIEVAGKVKIPFTKLLAGIVEEM